MGSSRTHYEWRQLREAFAPALCHPVVNYREMAAKHGIAVRTIRHWHQIVQDHGPAALIALHDGRPSQEGAREKWETPPMQFKDSIAQWSTSADGTCEWCNARYLWDYGLTFEEVQGDGWERKLHPEDLPRVLEAWRHSVATGTPYEQRVRQRTRDGEYHWFLCRGTPMLNNEGRIVRWHGFNIAIDEGRRTQESEIAEHPMTLVFNDH